MAEVRIKDIDEHEIDTILAEDIDFEGHLTFKKPLMIKGKFKGEIKSTSSLYIGEKAYVEAATEAGIVSSKGRHKGDIVGHARVELFSTAQVDGDITTPDFVVESGCKFNGHCNMGGGAKKETQHQQPSAPSGGAAPVPGGQQNHPAAQTQQLVSQKPGAAPGAPAPQSSSQQQGGQQQGGQQQKPPNIAGSSGGQQR
jgi:cytoskeletal protein CcmA (bactofilin family)